MTVGTRVNSSTGVKTSNDQLGLVIERDTANVGFSPFNVESVKAVTSATTFVPGDAGVITLSGNSAITCIMPPASASAGSWWFFRNTSNHQHILTGSQESQGTKAFGEHLTAPGSRLTMSGAVGQSVGLWCDGLHFVIMGVMSGNVPFTINGA